MPLVVHNILAPVDDDIRQYNSTTNLPLITSTLDSIRVFLFLDHMSNILIFPFYFSSISPLWLNLALVTATPSIPDIIAAASSAFSAPLSIDST